MSSITSLETGLSRLTTATIFTLPTEQIDYTETPKVSLENGQDESSGLQSPHKVYRITKQIERHAAILFSEDHLKYIIETPSELLKFTAFLKIRWPESVRVLVYYLDVLKAAYALSYTNAVLGALNNVSDAKFVSPAPLTVSSPELEERAASAFQHITEEYLPAYITQAAIQCVAKKAGHQNSRNRGSLTPEISGNSVEMFFLTDPSKPDNPIVFASEAFERVAAHNRAYIQGRSIRILEGTGTAQSSIRRIEKACQSGREHSEVLLCYPQDSAAFLGLLTMSPLCDSRGKVRYFLGALSDVSSLGEGGSDLESFQGVLQRKQGHMGDDSVDLEHRDELRDLCEMFNMSELVTVQRWGGRMHGDHQLSRPIDHSTYRASDEWSRPCQGRDELLHIIGPKPARAPHADFLLLRPFPSLRILFASPSLRLPGVLQSPFLARVGGSRRVREGLTSALAAEHSVMARIRWTTHPDEPEQPRWLHCTPLRGPRGRVGVWVVLLLPVVAGDRDEGGDRDDPWLRAGSPERIVSSRASRPMSRTTFTSSAAARANGVFWREADELSEEGEDEDYDYDREQRPRTSHRISVAASWADHSSFRSLGTDEASSLGGGSRWNLSVH